MRERERGACFKEADSDRWLECSKCFIVIGGVSMQLMEGSNKFNEQAQSYDGVMIDVPWFSQDLLDKGNGAHTPHFPGRWRHMWRYWVTQTME